ncbi:ABC transporter permease subunit [Eubacteriales bacterium OttesenSCG-928-A19]|nr:ABC transporter permease subunit [Eubacteriales bacterium OttesenSCG-928-A19]
MTRKSLPARIAGCWQLYVMLALPLLYIVVFAYVPIFGIQIAFRDFTIRGGIWNSPWVGMKYFIKFFESYKFWEIVKNTIFLSVYNIVASMPIPLILALALNVVRVRWYRKTIQMLSYMPNFISTVVMVSILLRVFSPRVGLYAQICEALGVRPVDLFGLPSAFRHMYVWSGVWQKAGWNTIMYLAALAAVDPELHEAAIVDGATRLQRVRHIDLPVVIPTATILLILAVGQMMSIGFEKVFLMQNSLNLSTSEIISTYVYKVGLTGNMDYSYSTAINFFNSIINFVLILSVNAVVRTMNGTNLF